MWTQYYPSPCHTCTPMYLSWIPSVHLAWSWQQNHKWHQGQKTFTLHLWVYSSFGEYQWTFPQRKASFHQYTTELMIKISSKSSHHSRDLWEAQYFDTTPLVPPPTPHTLCNFINHLSYDLNDLDMLHQFVLLMFQ